MIQFEIKEGVGKITLNRPEKYHSFVREMALGCKMHWTNVMMIIR